MAIQERQRHPDRPVPTTSDLHLACKFGMCDVGPTFVSTLFIRYGVIMNCLIRVDLEMDATCIFCRAGIIQPSKKLNIGLFFFLNLKYVRWWRPGVRNHESGTVYSIIIHVHKEYEKNHRKKQSNYSSTSDILHLHTYGDSHQGKAAPNMGTTMI